jgi:putative ABC transport system permease protein
VVNEILLRPLPYPQQNRIMMLFEENLQQGASRIPFSAADFEGLRNQSHSFESLALYQRGVGFEFSDEQGAEVLSGAVVSAGFFDVLGVRPILGRGFQSGDDAAGSSLQIVIAESFWERRFHRDPTIIGRVLNLGGVAHIVVGVVPSRVNFPSTQTEIWRNLRMPPATSHGHAFWAIGRLKSGVGLEQAAGDIKTVAKDLEKQYPVENAAMTFIPVPVLEYLAGNTRTALYVLIGAVAFVLMIASVNVANLILAKSAARQKEMAIRGALGAGRRRIVRQLTTESILLTSLGSVAGLIIAWWAVDLIVALAPADVFRIDQIHIDGSVLAFTVAISLLAGLCFGVVPAIQFGKIDLIITLKESGRGLPGEGFHRRLRSVLIVSEVTLSLVLLTGAGLTIRSFKRLSAVDPGFNPTNILAVRMAVSPAKYNSREKVLSLYTAVMDRAKRSPGVRSVALTNTLPPMQLDYTDSFVVEGQPVAAGSQPPSAARLIVTPDYFSTMSIPIVEGRGFTAEDRGNSVDVVMVNETLARRFFHAESPLGKRIQVGLATRENPKWLEIVGVARDVKYDGLDAPTDATFYLPYAQVPVTGQDLLLRTAADPAALINLIRDEIRNIDHDIPLVRVTTLEHRMSEAVGPPRFRTTLLAAFAGIALLLAGIGIYGVLSYSISLRTHEIGVRMSLGASRNEVLRMVVGEGMLLAIAGTALGLAGAAAVTRLMSGVLFEVSPQDPLTFVVVSILMLLAALLACLIPARRATRVDPMVALRYD